MAFDIRNVEAKLSLGLILPGDLPPVAWQALEAGCDGHSIRRMAALR